MHIGELARDIGPVNCGFDRRHQTGEVRQFVDKTNPDYHPADIE